MFALSSTVDKGFGMESHKPMIDKIIKDNPNATKEQIWYLFVLNLLKFRANKMKALYLESLIKETIIRYKGKHPPEDIALLVGQINNTLPSDGVFVSVYESINDDDLIVSQIVKARPEIKAECEKYFQYKNLTRSFIEKTIGMDKLKNKYADCFNILFDMFLMVCLNTIDEIFDYDLAEDEKAVRDFIFRTVDIFASQTFIKYKDKISTAICDILSKYKLSAEGDTDDAKE